MTQKKIVFPVKPTGDWIIIRRLKIKNIQEKKAEKGKLVLQEAPTPKNLLEVEKARLEEHALYDNAEKLMLEKWDEHPNQGIVVAIGPGRDIGNGVLLKPTVAVGDHILYRGKTGEPIVAKKQLFWIIKDHDVFGTVPSEVALNSTL